MNRRTILIVVALLLLTIVVIGGTYAYFSLTVAGNTAVSTGSSKFEVIYQGGEGYDGPLQLVSTKEEGHNETIKVKVAQGSVNAKLSLILTIDQMSTAMATTGFKWEIYGYKNNSQVYHNYGNFSGKSASAGNNTIALVNNDYTISEDETTFVVYWWLDGNMINNDIGGSSFKCHIGAQTETITGTPKTS